VNLDDRELSSFFDGELGHLESAEIERRIRLDPLARARVAELGRIRTGIREWARGQSAHVDVVDAVMERVRGDRLVAAAAPSGASRSLGRVSAGRASIAAALAIVASAALLTATDASVSRAEPAVQVETLDFGQHGGTLFVLEHDGATTPVIWLVDRSKHEVAERL
jgi:anti-sigma factor RsiW